MAICAECGKEFEAKGDWQKVCIDCYKANAGGRGSKPKTTAPAKTSIVSKKEVNAEMFRKAYDEIIAEFSDVLPEVKDYLGGWVSTIVINRSR